MRPAEQTHYKREVLELCGGQRRERRVSQLSYPELDLRDRSGIRARAGWPAAARMVYKCKDTFNDCNSVKLWPGCDHVPRHRH